MNKDVMTRFAEKMLKHLKQTAPGKSLKNKITYKIKGTKVIFEFPGKFKYTEYGTMPHTIKAKEGKSLHWIDEDGKDRFAKKVKHPGIQPTYFIRTAFNSNGIKTILSSLK